jgi:hypothetical protein
MRHSLLLCVQMQSNHLSHWLLIRTLIGCLEEAASTKGEARLIQHTSGASFKRPEKATGKLKPVDAQYLTAGAKITGDGAGDNPLGQMRRYQQSKLAQ